MIIELDFFAPLFCTASHATSLPSCKNSLALNMLSTTLELKPAGTRMMGMPPGFPVFFGLLADAVEPCPRELGAVLGAVSGLADLAADATMGNGVSSTGLLAVKKDAFVSKFMASKSLPTCSRQNTCSFTSRNLGFLIPAANSAACCCCSSCFCLLSFGPAKKSKTLSKSFALFNTEFLSLNTRSFNTPASSSSASRDRLPTVSPAPTSIGAMISILSLVAIAPVK
mmetsp:Transcript_4124/g.15068  ORF Transcript_4124/g.15068 Transcript_4124/m.15068 type:complete len:226 (+) Transcript_4124:461-1138(+)